MLLRVRPVGLRLGSVHEVTQRDEISGRDRPIAQLKYQSWDPGGQIQVDSTTYNVVYPSLTMGNHVRLMQGETCILELQSNKNLTVPTFEIEQDGKRYQLQSPGLNQKDRQLRDLICLDNQQIGTIRQEKGVLSRIRLVEVPDDTPLLPLLTLIWFAKTLGTF